MSADESPAEFTMLTTDARDTVLALTEMRGWVLAEPMKGSRFLLERIDKSLAAFGVLQAVQRVHHGVMEGNPAFVCDVDESGGQA